MPPIDAVERWLRRSGVPAFVPGYARPAAVLRRWPWTLSVAALVAAVVLLAMIVAGYGSQLGAGWLPPALVVGSLAVGVAATAVGLGEIALFAARWFLRIAWRSGAGMLRILPILLVALVFTFLSAETWQSIGRLTGTPLVLATTLLVLLALLPLVRSADEDHARFADAGDVRAALPADLAGALGTAPPDAAAAGTSDGVAAPDMLPLGRVERLNLRLVGALGRALVAAVVGLAVTAFFCVFGVLTVSDAVTSTWSGAPADVWWQFTVGTHRYTLSAEHVRVAMFLGVFSALYFVVSASTDRHLAEALSADSRAHLRQCLAVRAVYQAGGAPAADRHRAGSATTGSATTGPATPAVEPGG